MKKCVSTCIFNSDKYRKDYMKLPESIDKYLKDFDLIVYHEKNIPQYMLDNYKKFPFVILREKENSKGRDGCFWRYECYEEYDFCYFRDVDIPITPIDKFIIDDFLQKENKIAWVFCIHPRRPIDKQGFLMGGIFGMKKSDKIDMKSLLHEWKDKGYYGSDEVFLSKKIYPLEKPICYYENNKYKKTIFYDRNFESYVELKGNFLNFI
jgi:hypothetical protein